MVGCLVVLAIVVVLIVGGVVYVAVQWKAWAADWGSQAAISLIDESDLSDDEKSQVRAQIQGLAADFKSGAVTSNQMLEIVKLLVDGPLVPASILYEAQKEYLRGSALTDEEKAAGEVAMARLAAGVYEHSIDGDAIEGVFAPISTTARTGRGVHIDHKKIRLHLKAPEDCTDEELRAVISNAAAAADAAGVPQTPPAIDVSDEIQKAIDRATAGDPAPEGPGPAPQEPAPQGP